ncbi:hypothetical protein H072_9402 [Dactylellina haptotyla CBS 200.50]|uniref:Uncharacterized protein n=1 Tax=Dactylellina haptotyla (strain CBS 200.50) TaxID=1284197 RepID=S8A205_DACHA|nr:hypothetical protein H072_9402 [Dactylellina haptotyla CBS 200.50]
MVATKFISAQAGLVFLASTVSGLIIDLIPLPQTTSTQILRLCRPLNGQNPIAINPQKEACPNGGANFWLWDYNMTPNAKGTLNTLINLKGLDTPTKSSTYLLNEAGYNTRFSFGITQQGLRAQPSEFRIKRNGVYQSINVNNKLAIDDILEFYGPVAATAPDTTIRLQTQSKAPAYLIRQLSTSPSPQSISTAQYPIVTLRIASLGNQEIIAQKQSLWQKGTSFLSGVGNKLQSAYNLATPYLSNAYDSATNYLAQQGGKLYDAAGNAINTGLNAAGAKLGQLYDAAGNAINNGVNSATAWAGDQLTAAGNGISNGISNALSPLTNKVQELYDSAGNRINQFVGAAGNAITQLPNSAYKALYNAGNWVNGQVNNAANAAGNWVGQNVTPYLNQAGNALNSAVDYVTPSLANAGQWVGDQAASVYGTLAGQPQQQQQVIPQETEMVPLVSGQPLQGMPQQVQQGVGMAAQQGQPVVARGVDVGISAAGMEGVPPSGSDIGDESWTDLSASQFFRFRRV